MQYQKPNYLLIIKPGCMTKFANYKLNCFTTQTLQF